MFLIALTHRFAGPFPVRDNGEESLDAVPGNEEKPGFSDESPETKDQTYKAYQEACVRDCRSNTVFSSRKVSQDTYCRPCQEPTMARFHYKSSVSPVDFTMVMLASARCSFSGALCKQR